MHDGNADGGHYFTLIKDHQLNKWRKFSDTNVKFIDEDDVFAQANGGVGAMTAFWVFYIAKNKLERSLWLNLYNINENYLYSGLINNEIKQEVERANLQFLDELNDFKAEQLCEELFTDYKQQVAQAHNSLQSFGDKKQEILSVSTMARLLIENDHLSKRFILATMAN